MITMFTHTGRGNGGDDDGDNRTTGNTEQEGGPEAGDYELTDDIGTKIGEHEADQGGL